MQLVVVLLFQSIWLVIVRVSTDIFVYIVTLHRLDFLMVAYNIICKNDDVISCL